eukprot:6491306-Amphidinium_carterae.1
MGCLASPPPPGGQRTPSVSPPEVGVRRSGFEFVMISQLVAGSNYWLQGISSGGVLVFKSETVDSLLP